MDLKISRILSVKAGLADDLIPNVPGTGSLAMSSLSRHASFVVPEYHYLKFSLFLGKKE